MGEEECEKKKKVRKAIKKRKRGGKRERQQGEENADIRRPPMRSSVTSDTRAPLGFGFEYRVDSFRDFLQLPVHEL